MPHGRFGSAVIKVLITGADGYIGSVMGPYLRAQGMDVTGMDVGYYDNSKLYDFHQIPMIKQDIRTVTRRDLEGYDAVVHLAGLSNDPLSLLCPESTYDINFLGTLNVARMSREAGVRRFVCASSCSVYGIAQGADCDEESPMHPQTEYARCKVLSGKALRELACDGFSPVILRNATAYGPSPRMRFDLVLNNLAGLAWTRGEIAMVSDGTPWRPVVHVEDISHSVHTVLIAPVQEVHNEVFNVGSPDENYQVRELADAVGRAFPGCRVSIGSNGGDTRSYRVNFDKIAAKLGFRCKYRVDAGALQLREVFSQVGLTPEQFGMASYTRLKQIEHLLETGQLNDRLEWAVTATAE